MLPVVPTGKITSLVAGGWAWAPTGVEATASANSKHNPSGRSIRIMRCILSPLSKKWEGSFICLSPRHYIARVRQIPNHPRAGQEQGGGCKSSPPSGPRMLTFHLSHRGRGFICRDLIALRLRVLQVRIDVNFPSGDRQVVK